MSDLFYRWFYGAGSLLICLVTMLMARRGIHMLQLESYYLRQYARHMVKGVLPAVVIGLAGMSGRYPFF